MATSRMTDRDIPLQEALDSLSPGGRSTGRGLHPVGGHYHWGATVDPAGMYLSPRSFYTDFHPVKYSVRDPEVERRIVLLGRAGSGKSASVNTLCGRHVFTESRWGRFHTTQCQRAVITRYGRRMEILDTPGFLLDSDINSPKVKREFAKCIGISSPGPHIFVFVFPTPHMHKCDVEIFQKFIHVFGDEVLRYTILLFSKADDLDYFSLTKQAFILSAPAEWKAIMKACNYRCVWFQNRASPLDKEVMVKTFIETMETTITRNVGRYFSNSLYWAVEKSIRRRDVTQHDQAVRLSMLRRKLRMNLDAGSPHKHGDVKKEASKMREDFRHELEKNSLKLIDTIWNVIKFFDCIKILKRPKIPHKHRHQNHHAGALIEEEEVVPRPRRDVHYHAPAADGEPVQIHTDRPLARRRDADRLPPISQRPKYQ